MVKFIFKTFFRQYLYFMGIFEVSRLAFLLFFWEKTRETGLGEAFKAFPHAFWIDNSTASYLLIIPWLLLLLYALSPRYFWLKINRLYLYLMTVLLVAIEVSGMAIYREWSIKVTYKALSYMNHLDEAVRSVDPWLGLGGLLAVALFSGGLIVLSKKLNIIPLEKERRGWPFALVWLLVMPLFIFGGMRGSISQIPISQSKSFYSKSYFANTAAVNTAWNLMYSIEQNAKYLNKNPFLFYSTARVDSLTAPLFEQEDSATVSILTTQRPNIVFIFLESWSGSFIDALGHNRHITPGFARLIKEGYFFSRHYASGVLSHQGLAAVFSGWPSTPLTSMSKQPSKFSRLPALPAILQQHGYHNSFCFGGELMYGNIKAYIMQAGFDVITEQKDFTEDWPVGSLGYHDEYLYRKMLSEIGRQKEPFFAGGFTLSSHSPFDQPVQDALPWPGQFHKLVNSVHYADSCLYNFIQQAKKQSWYHNTLFVFVADHAHPSPFEYGYYSYKKRNIPLLFYGDVIKAEYRGTLDSGIISQTDIAATLLAQMNLPYDDFVWSKNALQARHKQWAYYGFDNGFGWISPKGHYAWIMDDDKLVNYHFDSPGDSLALLHQGKAFLQKLYTSYQRY